MAFAVGFHVSAAHGGYQGLVNGRPWQIPVVGGTVAVAMIARCAMALDPARLWLWMGVASGAFLLATVFWILLVVPLLFSTQGPKEPPT